MPIRLRSYNLVPYEGVEPPILSASVSKTDVYAIPPIGCWSPRLDSNQHYPDFKSSASANWATRGMADDY